MEGGGAVFVEESEFDPGRLPSLACLEAVQPGTGLRVVLVQLRRLPLCGKRVQNSALLEGGLTTGTLACVAGQLWSSFVLDFVELLGVLVVALGG